jgi:hypothetical protein
MLPVEATVKMLAIFLCLIALTFAVYMVDNFDSLEIHGFPGTGLVSSDLDYFQFSKLIMLLTQ